MPPSIIQRHCATLRYGKLKPGMCCGVPQTSGLVVKNIEKLWWETQQRRIDTGRENEKVKCEMHNELVTTKKRRWHPARQ